MLRVERLRIGGLRPVTFELGDGACLAVEGPSGSGKTRLLRALADLDAAEGQVFLDGSERGDETGAAWRKRVRFVAAEPAWWTDTPRAALPAFEGAGERAERLMQALGLEPSMLDRPLSRLSTGERQRIALVRALLDDPRVLLLDEPTAALDPASAALVEDLIRLQMRAGRSVILVTHSEPLVARIADARLQLADPRKPAPRADVAPPVPGPRVS